MIETIFFLLFMTPLITVLWLGVGCLIYLIIQLFRGKK